MVALAAEAMVAALVVVTVEVVREVVPAEAKAVVKEVETEEEEMVGGMASSPCNLLCMTHQFRLRNKLFE